MSDAPVVFVSYSHDSPDHKRWVAMLAGRLREKGIDAILDQWDLQLGDDLTRFMEESVRRAARVLVICTPQYVRKAAEGAGGVGYERLIVTAELVHDVGTRKFIPIVRSGDGQEKTPTFLGPRIYADFTDDTAFESQLDHLIHELHGVPPVPKPPLGPHPFSPAPPEGDAAPPLAPVAPLPPTGDTDPTATYRSAMDLARHHDLVGWRLLTKDVRRFAFQALRAWPLAFVQTGPPLEKDAAKAALREALTPLGPLFALALAGVESSIPELRAQQSLVDDLLSPPGWPDGGLVNLVEYPRNFVYVYQALHGATCLHTGQAELALALAEMPVPRGFEKGYIPLWRDTRLIGWPQGLPDDCISAWGFLLDLPGSWPWLLEVFGDELAYQTALSAYSMTLNIFELAWALKNQPEVLEDRSARLGVPPMFFFTHAKVGKHPLALLRRAREPIRSAWARLGVPEQVVREAWPKWMTRCQNWMQSAGRFWTFDPPHAEFLQTLD